MEKYESHIEKEKLITEVEPIEESKGKIISELEDFEKLIEEPLRDAVRILTEKGIQTLSSSANRKDIENRAAHIIINADNLSHENKQKLEKKEYAKTIDFDEYTGIELQLPLSESTEANKIKQQYINIAENLAKQKADWIPAYSLDEIMEQYAIPLEEKDEYKNHPEYFDQYYFDPESNKFYTGKWICEIKKKLDNLN